MGRRTATAAQGRDLFWPVVLGMAAFGLLAVLCVGDSRAQTRPHSAQAQTAQALTKVTFGTDWLAQAEHGGFYQALAAGIYAKHGLDVTIRQGGPQSNPAQNVAAGVVDFQLGSESFFPLNFVQQDIPVVTVAAFMQKNPRVLMAHPGQGNDTLEGLKGKPIMISASAQTGFWAWLKAKYGYTDSQIRPYTFNQQPFLADKRAIQQGFLTSEPFAVEKEGGVKPVIMLLSDNGFASYCNLILVKSQMVRERPQVVQAFIDASIEGWYSYIYADSSPGDAWIKRENREMDQERIDNALRLFKQYGVVDSGESLELGIGAMTDATWKAFWDSISATGVYPPNLDYRKAYTTQFVNKKHAIHMRH